MPLDSDYVLGTHDEEIARLGIQHQVWRPHMLDAWARAGMTRGSSADQLQRDFRESARNPAPRAPWPARLDRRATRRLPATMLSLPDRRIRSRPNRRSPEEFGAAPEQSILKQP